MKLTTHLHLVPRLRMCWSIHPLSMFLQGQLIFISFMITVESVLTIAGQGVIWDWSVPDHQPGRFPWCVWFFQYNNSLFHCHYNSNRWLVAIIGIQNFTSPLLQPSAHCELDFPLIQIWIHCIGVMNEVYIYPWLPCITLELLQRSIFCHFQ